MKRSKSVVKKPEQKKPKKETSPETPAPETPTSGETASPWGGEEPVVKPDAPKNDVAPAPKTESGAFGTVWILALLAIVIGGGYATLPLWKAYVPGLEGVLQSGTRAPAVVQQQNNDTGQEAPVISDIERERNELNAKLSVLIERLGSLEQQLGDVRKMVDATALPDEVAIANKSLQQLSGRLSKIEENNEAAGTVLDRLNRLEQDITDAAAPPTEMKAAIGEIAKRLDSLESGNDENRRLTAEQSSAQALVLAVGQLRQILPTGAPYALALQTVQRIGGTDEQVVQAVQSLQAHGETGVPSLSALSKEYADLSGDISAAAPGAEMGFFEQTWGRIKSLVRVSRTDGADGDPSSADAVADHAEQALHEGDLQAAVDILQKLQTPSARVQEWSGRAQTRLAAERALALLNVYAVSRLIPAPE